MEAFTRRVATPGGSSIQTKASAADQSINSSTSYRSPQTVVWCADIRARRSPACLVFRETRLTSGRSLPVFTQLTQSVSCLGWQAGAGSARFRTGLAAMQRRAGRRRKCHGLVEGQPVLEAAVELAEELVEQVAGGGGMAVTVFPPLAVMLAGGLAVGGGRKGPHPAGVGQPVVLDMAVGDRDRASGRTGDRRGSGVSLQRAGVGEPGSVITDLGEHPCTGRVREPGEARDDRVVGMRLEQLRRRLAELVDIDARRIERGEQSQRVFAHRGLDQKWLAQLGFPQSGVDLGGGLIDATATAGASQRRGDPAHRQLGGRGRGGRDRQHGAGLRARDTQREPFVKTARKVG